MNKRIQRRGVRKHHNIALPGNGQGVCPGDSVTDHAALKLAGAVTVCPHCSGYRGACDSEYGPRHIGEDECEKIERRGFYRVAVASVLGNAFCELYLVQVPEE